MNKMRSFLVWGTLLCILCVVQIESQSSPNTLRLCGRAFVRALVYTCGGSRWKRLTGEEWAQLQETKEVNPFKRDVLNPISRQWRDQHQALMTECCDIGCQKNDLTLLC